MHFIFRYSIPWASFPLLYGAHCDTHRSTALLSTINTLVFKTISVLKYPRYTEV